jgi:hypothetical protein
MANPGPKVRPEVSGINKSNLGSVRANSDPEDPGARGARAGGILARAVANFAGVTLAKAGGTSTRADMMLGKDDATLPRAGPES